MDQVDLAEVLMNEWEMCDDVRDAITDKNSRGSKPDMNDRGF